MCKGSSVLEVSRDMFGLNKQELQTHIALVETTDEVQILREAKFIPYLTHIGLIYAEACDFSHSI